MGERRIQRLAGTLGHLLADEARRTLGPDGNELRQRQRARAVREAFEGLGPFYIKVGQILATRPDLVSAATVDELAALHDRVPATRFSDFESVLRAELGDRWNRRFRHIDIDRPLGSASLAQVYAVTLSDGRHAALKVQRPGIRPTVHADMAVLRRAALILAKARPRLNAVVDVHAMLEVVFDAMTAELDFTAEAGNMEDGAHAARRFDRIAVPQVLLATPRVLIQTVAPGRSIRDALCDEFPIQERIAVARDLFAFMLRSYYVHRTFHADPHPGNIFVQPGGSAFLLDWGMVGRIDRPTSLKVLLTMANMAQNNGDGAAKAWVELGSTTPWADVEGFSSDVTALVPRLATATLAELDLGVTLSTVLRHSTRRGIKIHPAVTMLGKSFANIEGSIRHLAPELSASQVLRAELVPILVNVVCETFSRGHLVRNALELVLAADGGLDQTRRIVRDLANHQLHLQVDTPTLNTAQQTKGLRAVLSQALLGAGATSVLRHLSRHDTR
ncbi:AarF/UbiB family protein [Amycolatopsis sp. NPDC051071]|uniref:ABC1 kinase family protein n=1 Tax=Amycolatopsis sp. NPDC051071 TaxID=3154637 RepID=UPI003445E862